MGGRGGRVKQGERQRQGQTGPAFQTGRRKGNGAALAGGRGLGTACTHRNTRTRTP